MLSNPTQQHPTINPFLKTQRTITRTPTHERVAKTSRITEMNSAPNHQQQQQQQDETNNINNPYNETPSTEPFNIDPDLFRVLAKNQAIIALIIPGFGEEKELGWTLRFARLSELVAVFPRNLM
ncbi:hypothetical protein PGTUg99_000514 [Puccinia graminis f. sp. tritici]|uniref:Uncharacterized protein n=1 Tax=Puccinia graminis f. sp. tritici TaxID=56615 RepID=A0A5B0LJ79_PUCGR|nr:hypothetical protein PGTUg99_000514 [Puccinia graminis f. sp. tritici]